MLYRLYRPYLLLIIGFLSKVFYSRDFEKGKEPFYVYQYFFFLFLPVFFFLSLTSLTLNENLKNYI